MTWSFRLGRVLGIDLKIHATFLLLLLFYGIQGLHTGVGGAVFGVAFILLLFLCVTLHELGHAIVAQRFGIPVHQIILLPIGGLAVLGRNPTTPREELLVAIAGPVVNVVIALGLGIGFAFANHLKYENITEMLDVSREHSMIRLIHGLFQANVALALFNLIPAFPMDGGRILRGILGFYMTPTRATRVATGVGQIVAVALFFWAILGPNLFLAVIAVFVFFAAGAERLQSQAGTVLSTRRVGDAYNRYALTLSLEDRVSKVVDYLLQSYQPDFAVVHRGQLQGIVTRQDVTGWLSRNTYDVFVTEVMQEPSHVLWAPADASLEDVRLKLTEQGKRVAAVYEGSTFLGLVSLEDIAEAMMILGFLEQARGAGGQFSTARRVAGSGARPGGEVVEPM